MQNKYEFMPENRIESLRKSLDQLEAEGCSRTGAENLALFMYAVGYQDGSREMKEHAHRIRVVKI